MRINLFFSFSNKINSIYSLFNLGMQLELLNEQSGEDAKHRDTNTQIKGIMNCDFISVQNNCKILRRKKGTHFCH